MSQPLVQPMLKLLLADVAEEERPQYEILYNRVQKRVFRLGPAAMASLSLLELMAEFSSLPPNSILTRRIFMLAITSAIRNKKGTS